MSDSRSAFLRAIERDFDDDTPRLVYADWLEENGDSDRAEFIRLQCEVERVPAGPDRAQMASTDWKRHWYAATTADRLLRLHWQTWKFGLPDWCVLWSEFDRGFPRVHTFTGRQLLDDGAAVRAVTPLGGRVRVWQLDGRQAQVFRCKHLARVTDLSLMYAQLTDIDVRGLATSPVLAGLKALDLTQNDVGDAGAAAVLGSPHLHRLQRLSLRDNPAVTATTARLLLADGRRWEWIDLNGTGVSDDLRAAVQARCEAP